MARIDRIWVDILQWINQLVWWRDQKVERKPYEKLQTWRLAGLGLLHRVSRPQDLCPRDVGSYIFEPFRYGSANVRDLHILCDHLEGMKHPHAWDRTKICTHRITVLIADHWVGEDGRYEAEELFSLDDDFQGQSPRRDLHIPCILHQVALGVAAAYEILESFDFLVEVDNAKRYCMRQDYTYTLRLPKPSGYAIAKPVDGGKPVRVRLD